MSCGAPSSERRVSTPVTQSEPKGATKPSSIENPANPVTVPPVVTSTGENPSVTPPVVTPPVVVPPTVIPPVVIPPVVIPPVVEIPDPLYSFAWHLKNTAQNLFSQHRGVAGVDLNVETVHASGIRGAGVVVAVSDSGIEISHEDLSGNYLAGRSKDFSLASPFDGDPLPKNTTDTAAHGTSVTGIIAAQGWNGLGSRGVAPRAKFIGFNTLADGVVQNAQKMVLQIDAAADVFNYSYGVRQCLYAALDTNTRSSYIGAYKSGVNTRRSGKGAVYLKAAGNSFEDSTSDCMVPTGWQENYLGNANLSETNNDPYTTIVAALAADGASSSYSSPGSNVWVSGFGGEFGGLDPAIVTTDLTGCTAGSSYTTNPTNLFQRGGVLNSNCQYTSTMNGTSSATPTVAGVVALIMEANPTLTWRDIKYILASTATVVNPDIGSSDHPLGDNLAGYVYQEGWVRNAAGFYFHNWFGFGLVNAQAAVNLAKNYSLNLGVYKAGANPNNDVWPYASPNLSLPIPNNSATGVSSTINVRHNLTLEAVQIRVTVTHPYIENVGIELISPAGTKSILTNINSGIYGSDFNNALFLSNAFLGESSLGNWTIKVLDGADINPDGSIGSSGTLVSWKINPIGHAPVGAVDQTAPLPVGPVTHAAYFRSIIASPAIAFTGSTSPDVLRYEMSVGTSAGATDTYDWFSLGLLTSTTISSLNLAQGGKYYVNVRAIDQSENISSVTSSLGWTADTLATLVVVPNESQLSLASSTSHTITGSCEPGAALVATPVAPATVSSVACSGAGIMTIVMNLPERYGEFTVGVVQTDQAGNVSGSKSIAFYYVPRGIEQLSLGDNHACLINATGSVRCWGNNSDGQLGNGGSTNSSAAVVIPTLVFKTIGTGSKHSCAVTTAGGAKCWGSNASGQLGDSTLVSRSSPVDVSGLTSSAKYVVSGSAHSCALTTAGAVRCWGKNGTGSLGNGSNIDSNVPVDVTGLGSGVKYIFANRGQHSCALTNAGGVKCWGDNRYGQLGDGTTTSRTTPVDVTGLTSGVEYLYLSALSSCARLNSGAFKCWGNNQNGQLGDSTQIHRSTAVDVTITSNIRDLSLGESNTCALKSDSSAVCWGYNSNIQLNSTSRYLAVPVAYPVSSLIAHRNGMSFQCSLAASGSVQCRGLRTSGQTGEALAENAATMSPSIKTQLLGTSTIAEDISVGREHLCFTTSAHKVYCLGSNDAGELGDGFSTTGALAGQSKAVEVLDLSGIADKAAVGQNHSCVLTTAGAVSCWGDNTFGQLGDAGNVSRFSPAYVSGLTSGVAALTVGSHHSCVLTTTGGVKCWGRNNLGQLGDSSLNNASSPVDVNGLTSGVISLSVSGATSCAVLSTGEAKCWGSNLNGQLGDGTVISKAAPVTVSGLTSGTASVAVGESHSCSVSSTGAVKCWGSNGSCELGSGATPCDVNVLSPQAVAGMTTGIDKLRLGNGFSCALMTNRAMRCWGSNSHGQLGAGATGSSYTNFQEVTSTNAPYLSSYKLFVGGSTSCMIIANKTAYCWGSNGLGQRGDGLADTPLNFVVPPVSAVY